MGVHPYEAVDSDKPLYFVGSSKDDLSAFPDEVKLVIGFALRMAQRGEKHAQAKPWKGDGSGVFEIVEDDGDAYRAVYVTRLAGVVYTLHAFQKKSATGIKTSANDVASVKRRLKMAERHFAKLKQAENKHGKSKRK
jgi:phage-related protein